MITDKQRQRDYEYEADYQSKSRYTTEQWTNILNSGQLDENNISLLKQIYSSFNHAATLLQLSFESNRTQEDLLSQLNAAGQLLEMCIRDSSTPALFASSCNASTKERRLYSIRNV